MILYSLFIPILAPKRHIDKYFDYIKQLKPFQGSKTFIRPLPNAEAEQMFLERVVLKCLFDFWGYLRHFLNSRPAFNFRAFRLHEN